MGRKTQRMVAANSETQKMLHQDALSEKYNQIKANSNYIFKFIEPSLLQYSEYNKKYSHEEEDINALKKSILVHGLIHNLNVMESEDKEFYYIISGENRMRALLELREEKGEDYFQSLFPAGVPCKVIPFTDNPLLIKAKINAANMDQRNVSILKKIEYVNEQYEIYEELAKQDSKYKKTIQEMADSLAITRQTFLMYRKAYDLIPPLKEMLDKNQISLNEASHYGALDTMMQEQVYEYLAAGKPIADEILSHGKKMTADLKAQKKLEERVQEKEQKVLELKEKLENTSGNYYKERVKKKLDKTENDLEQLQENLDKQNEVVQNSMDKLEEIKTYSEITPKEETEKKSHQIKKELRREVKKLELILTDHEAVIKTVMQEDTPLKDELKEVLEKMSSLIE